jgi:hypothetical protein
MRDFLVPIRQAVMSLFSRSHHQCRGDGPYSDSSSVDNMAWDLVLVSHDVLVLVSHDVLALVMASHGVLVLVMASHGVLVLA